MFDGKHKIIVIAIFCLMKVKNVPDEFFPLSRGCDKRADTVLTLHY